MAHHLSLLRPCMASQAGSLSKEVSGASSKSNRVWEIAGDGRAPNPALSSCAIPNSPRHANIQMSLTISKVCILCQLNWL